MLDFAWSEIALIGAVALVVLGPKELPKALRTAGQLVRKARIISSEFRSSVDQMVREAELDEMKRDIEKAATVDIRNEIEQAVDPGGDLAATLRATETEALTATTPPEDAVPALPAAEPLPALPEPASTDAAAETVVAAVADAIPAEPEPARPAPPAAAPKPWWETADAPPARTQG